MAETGIDRRDQPEEEDPCSSCDHKNPCKAAADGGRAPHRCGPDSEGSLAKPTASMAESTCKASVFSENEAAWGS